MMREGSVGENEEGENGSLAPGAEEGTGSVLRAHLQGTQVLYTRAEVGTARGASALHRPIDACAAGDQGTREQKGICRS